ncbi:hypothetical protein [Phaeobacter piscinae]|uniref:hypothetical protein n=1 Tax=Phaeobacter piscinae TaxID=1580596 RepID=UPI000C99A458|nr:hypothetical protein [Phaeobacter piscinae]AUQ74758.1 hypothetical protein PhaeoP71_01897 [Phaeobacter piscinae]
MTLEDHFARWFKGDTAAVDFAEHLWHATQEWDDLEDEGKCANHNALLSWLAFGKEYTPFFADHAHILRPAMLNMYLQWRAANVLERGDRNDVAKAYMLRAAIYGVFHNIAWIVGGDDWAAQVGPEIYRMYAETPEELWKEMN